MSSCQSCTSAAPFNMAPQVTSRVQPLEEDPVIVKEGISTLRELVAVICNLVICNLVICNLVICNLVICNLVYCKSSSLYHVATEIAEPKLHVRTDDLFMMKYLRCADLDPQRAFQRMKQYYKLKANCKDWFASTSPREQKEVLQQHITTMLRERDCYGRRVLICKLAHSNPFFRTFDECGVHMELRGDVNPDDSCVKPRIDVLGRRWQNTVHGEEDHLAADAALWRNGMGGSPNHVEPGVPLTFDTFVAHAMSRVMRAANADPGKVTAYQWSHTDDLWLETALEEEETQKNGISVIVDAGNIPWKFLKFANPFNATFVGRKSDALPVRHIEHHVVNTSFFMNALIALVFPFLSNRTKESIHFHYQDRASLHKFINPEILPEEYGGKVPEIEYEEQEKYLHEKEDVLLESYIARFTLLLTSSDRMKTRLGDWVVTIDLLRQPLALSSGSNVECE
uniref:CRAL-TRIO domain-containing protein n=1 Tax=Timema genevievae TaxID=629358 RepID=A0A7R9PPW3_TIMGE|nr:unnamed protein product [Timema genevievae]